MEIAVIILSIIVLCLAALVFAQSAKGRGKDLDAGINSLRAEVQNSLSSTVKHINAQLASTTAQVSEQLSSVTAQLNSSTGQINTRMDNAAKAVSTVSHALGELSKATEQVYEVGKSISGLERILTAPKLRGGLGELFLGDLLASCLPTGRFELQYGFADGTRVDAVIRLTEGLVPIDSKFPLENFRRICEAPTDDAKRSASRKFASDCRKHVDAIASAYIRPAEGTINLALMYIPAESVYYELITMREGDTSFSDYALSKRVVPVSPNSFYAYLQTVLMGLKGMEIGERAGEILAHLTTLRQEFDRFTADLETLGKHVNFAKAKYEEVERKAQRFGDRLEILGEEQKQKELV